MSLVTITDLKEHKYITELRATAFYWKVRGESSAIRAPFGCHARAARHTDEFTPQTVSLALDIGCDPNLLGN